MVPTKHSRIRSDFPCSHTIAMVTIQYVYDGMYQMAVISCNHMINDYIDSMYMEYKIL